MFRIAFSLGGLKTPALLTRTCSPAAGGPYLAHESYPLILVGYIVSKNSSVACRKHPTRFCWMSVITTRAPSALRRAAMPANARGTPGYERDLVASELMLDRASSTPGQPAARTAGFQHATLLSRRVEAAAPDIA